MDDPDPPRTPAGSVAGAIAMVVIGLVIFIPSGLCTSVLGGGALVQMFIRPGSSEGIAVLTMALATGGPFVGGGFALIWYGVKRLRGRK